jgi:glycosyltransferase involved in cell wall biosynthesis
MRVEQNSSSISRHSSFVIHHSPFILHIDSGREWRGGQAQVLNLCRGLKARGVSLVLAAQPGSPLLERAAKAGIETFPVAMRGEFDVVAAHRLRRIIQQQDVTLVHAHDAHAHALARMAVGRRRVALVVSRRVDFPISEGFFSRRKYLDPRIHYFAISNGVRDVLVMGGVPPERIHVVPSGVDPNRFTRQTPPSDLRSQFGIPESAPIIGTIGSLVEHKGHRYLIEAAPMVLGRHPNARFFIVGEGELRADLEARIREKNLRAAFFLPGFREDLETFLSGFDIFVLPSHLEGLCTSLIDAMLFRLPAVGCDTGGVPDLIQHEKTGLLVEPRNPRSLAEALLRLLEDQPLAARLGEAAQAHALTHFSADAMVEQTLAGYNSLVISPTARNGAA